MKRLQTIVCGASTPARLSLTQGVDICHLLRGRRLGERHKIREIRNRIAFDEANAIPLYDWLKKEAPGVLGTKSIKWNFTKFLIGRDGKVIKRYAPKTKPKELDADIESALAFTAS